MADAVISFLLEKLNQLLSQEVNLLLGVEDEVRSLTDELKLMVAFLRDFEGKRSKQNVVNEWMRQLKEAAHEAEDVIDYYAVKVTHERRQNLFVKVTGRREAGRKIEDVKTRMREIFNKKINYNIQITQSGELPKDDVLPQRRRRLSIKETDVVGFDDEARAIINELTGGEPPLDVVPIVGMAGLGKTTLARKVYNDPIVKGYFDCRAWVYVSQDYRLRELLLAIIKCAMVLTDDMEKMDDDDLGLELYKYLSSTTRYLIVLDDVWNTEFWDELNEIFPNNIHGSRIIITTRINDVALYTKPSNPPHNLRLLSKEESWELFSKTVFRAGSCCPPELEEIGKKIAEQCGRLPLAIVVLAGLLSGKEKTYRRWLKVSNSVSSLLTGETKRCMDILALSYNNLPRHLKDCFLYFGVFPEDFEIPAKQLIRLWLAEGFVQQRDRKTVEDTAEDYLDELIARNLIQVAKRTSDGGVKTCRIHDLLLELCISNAKQEKFLEVRGYPNSSSPSNSRRIGIHSNTLNCISSNPAPANANLRSFLCFGLNEGQLSLMRWNSIYPRFTLLRVLDLWGVVVATIPADIESLIHLRYLRLKSHTAPTLPPSISNLWNLRTLVVKAPCIDRPEIGIWKMRQLRHLHFHRQAVLQKPPKRMCNEHDGGLSNLQILSSISPDSCTESVLSKLPNLIKLGICGDLHNHLRQAFPNLAKLNSLKTLKLVRDCNYSRMIRLPDPVEFPSNLTKLTLLFSELYMDPMYQLEQLPNLEILKLKHDYKIDKLECSTGGFPKLQILKLIDLDIRKWEVSTGAMSSLRSVVIKGCSNLKNLPSALQHMTTLQELELWWPNVSMVNQATDIQNSMRREKLKLLIHQPETK